MESLSHTDLLRIKLLQDINQMAHETHVAVRLSFAADIEKKLDVLLNTHEQELQQ